MGIYIYTLRTTKSDINVDGTFQPVYRFEFAYKQSYWLGESYTDRLLNNAEDRFGRLSQDGVILVTVGKPEEGQPVYLTTRSAWNDGSDFPGVVIGEVKRIKGRWHCVNQKVDVSTAKANLKRSGYVTS